MELNIIEEEKTTLIFNQLLEIDSKLNAIVRLLYEHQMDITRVEGLVKSQPFLSPDELDDLQEKYLELKKANMPIFQEAFNNEVKAIMLEGELYYKKLIANKKK